MIRLAGAIRVPAVLFFSSNLFADLDAIAQAFCAIKNRVVKASGLGISRGEGADQEGLPVVRQFTGAFGVFDGFRAIAQRRIRAGGKQPGQIY